MYEFNNPNMAFLDKMIDHAVERGLLWRVEAYHSAALIMLDTAAVDGTSTTGIQMLEEDVKYLHGRKRANGMMAWEMLVDLEYAESTRKAN